MGDESIRYVLVGIWWMAGTVYLVCGGSMVIPLGFVRAWVFWFFFWLDLVLSRKWLR